MSTVTLSHNNLIILQTLAYGRVEEVKQAVESGLALVAETHPGDPECLRARQATVRADYQYMCDLRALAGKLDVLIEERV